MSNGQMNIVMSDGVTIVVPDDIGLMTPYVLLEQRDWFEEEIHFVRRFAGQGMSAIDVGANYGVYTLALARAVGSSGRIWAFEPASRTAGFLTQSLELNGFSQVKLMELGLSDHEGTATLRTYPNSELNSLHAGSGGEGEMIALCTLDACEALGQGRRFDFIKLDVEGEEANVVKGGRRFFAEQSPLVMFEIRSRVEITHEVPDLLLAAGYRIFRLVPGLQVLVPWEPAEPLDPYQLNLFAAKADRIAALAEAGCLVGDDREEISMRPPLNLWWQILREQPWAAELLPRWQALCAPGGSDDWMQYRDALNQFFVSAARNGSAPLRFNALRSCFEALGRLAQVRPTLPILSSFARVAAAFGKRGTAVKILLQLRDMVATEGNFDLNTPLLPADRRFEGLAFSDVPRDWIVVSILETLERLQNFSSYFAPEESAVLLREVVGRRFHGEESRGRQRLSAMRQAGGGSDDQG